MKLTTGVEPLDARLGDVDPGGLYLLAGPPDSMKLAALLQFLSTGLEAGGRCALVTGSDPASVVAQASRWGLPLEREWRDGRLAVLGFEGDFARRLAHAGHPEAVFDELAGQLGPGHARIAIDPGSPLWETRTDGAMGTRFLKWVDATGATVWATVSGPMTERLSPATEWVMQGARGVLEFERSNDGGRQIWVRKLDADVELDGPISVELVSGEGVTVPRGEPRRRSTDLDDGAERRLLLLNLALELPADIAAWARSCYAVMPATDPLVAVEALSDEGAVGTCLVYVDRLTMARGIQVCRTLRPLTRAAVVLLADDELRADDRTLALEAGADDVVSGGVHLPELERRLELAREAVTRSPEIARRPAVAEASRGSRGGLVEAGAFRRRVLHLARVDAPSVFTLLVLRMPGYADHLLEAVGDAIRAEGGDLAAELEEGAVALVLRGSRPGQARAFLTRLSRSLSAQESEALQSEVLASPLDARAIRTWAAA